MDEGKDPMTGRHFTLPALRKDEEADVYYLLPGLHHVMRSAYPEPLRVTHLPLPTAEARTHADSLNQNDQDDIDQHGEVQS